MSSFCSILSSADLVDYRFLILVVPSIVWNCASIPLIRPGRTDVPPKDDYASYLSVVTYCFRRLVIRNWICRDRWSGSLVATPRTWCERRPRNIERELSRELSRRDDYGKNADSSGTSPVFPGHLSVHPSSILITRCYTDIPGSG